MKKQSLAKKCAKVLASLKKAYPDIQIALTYSNPFELIISVILSAQCTDAQVNRVTPALFKKFSTPESLAHAPIHEVETLIRSTGFFHNKAKNIIGCARGLVEKFKSHVPASMAELTQLPGVGRKTANVILSHVFDINEGVCVDTHVGRLSNRIGFSKYTDAIHVERDLMALLPQAEWKNITDVLIRHGRRVCFARKPNCGECVVSQDCNYFLTLRSTSKPLSLKKV